MTTDTEDDFKAMTGEGVEEGEIPTLIDEEDPIDIDEKIPDDAIIDPLLPIDDDEDKEEDELDDKAEIEAVMWQDYDER
jgi:hypothetical protein